MSICLCVRAWVAVFVTIECNVFPMIRIHFRCILLLRIIYISYFFLVPITIAIEYKIVCLTLSVCVCV